MALPICADFSRKALMTWDCQRLNTVEFAYVQHSSWELWKGQLRAPERSASRGGHVHDPKHGNGGSPRPAERAFLGRQEHGGNIGAHRKPADRRRVDQP